MRVHPFAVMATAEPFSKEIAAISRSPVAVLKGFATVALEVLPTAVVEDW
jgi:hypothetical protein